jgi:hypothetical protein
MKFDKKFTNFLKYLCFFLFLIHSLSSIRKNRLLMNLKDEQASVFVNRGFSFLNFDKDVSKDVEKLAMKKKIFNFDIDVSKNYFGDFYVSLEHLRHSLNRNVTLFNTEEMRKNSELSLKGDYIITVDSNVYNHANSHILRKVVTSQVFADTIGKISLSLNHNKNFPNFDNQIVEEAYKTFYKGPHTKSEHPTVKDIVHDKNTVNSVIKFFDEYGTHYFSEILLGYRFGFHQEFKNKTTILKDKSGKVPIPDLTKFSFLEKVPGAGDPSALNENNQIANSQEPQRQPQTTDNIQTNSPTVPSSPVPEKAGANIQPDLYEFYIGECKIERNFIKPESCNPINPRPVRYTLHPIHHLFNPLLQNKKDFSSEGEAIDQEKMKSIHSNMNYFYNRIQGALDPNLFVVTKIESFKLAKSEAKNHPCLNIKHTTLNKIYKSYGQTRKIKFYQQDLFINNKHIPVTTFKNYNQLKKNYHIVSNGGDGLFWCLTREHNITPQELKSGKWENKKFLMDIKTIIDHDSIPFTEAGYQCTETWNFVDKQSKNENRWHFCTKWTDNFMESRIVTDVKFFEFHKNVAKCNDGHLETYLDGKKYECDCGFNYNKISDEKKQGDTYLCMSKKINTFLKPISPNMPKSSADKTSK